MPIFVTGTAWIIIGAWNALILYAVRVILAFTTCVTGTVQSTNGAGDAAILTITNKALITQFPFVATWTAVDALGAIYADLVLADEAWITALAIANTVEVSRSAHLDT